MLKSTTFTLDGIGGRFPGYTKRLHWNGWAMPYFDIGVAMILMDEYNKGAYDMPKMFYEDESDSFIIPPADPEDDVIIFKGVTINDGRYGWLHLYPIGAGCWVWDDESEW